MTIPFNKVQGNVTLPRATVEQVLTAFETDDWQKKLMAAQAIRAALQAQAKESPNGLPERDQSNPAERQGIFRKFNVQRTDGGSQPGRKHHGCEYFVLDVAHDQHAKPALEAYAAACAATHPQLSADMRARYGLQVQVAVPATAVVARLLQVHEGRSREEALKIAESMLDAKQGIVESVKDHQIAALVGRLTQIAMEYHSHQSLRQRISQEVNSLHTAVSQTQAAMEHEPENEPTVSLASVEPVTAPDGRR